MRIGGTPGGSDWNGSGPRFGLCHGFFYNLCRAVSSCFYVFCCCWLLEDCFVGRRSLPGPSYGSPSYGSPEPPQMLPRHTHIGHIGPESQGFFGSGFNQPGPPGPPQQPGPFGYPGEPAPF